MAKKAGREKRNPNDKREMRAAKGSRTSRRANTKTLIAKRGPRR